MNLVEQVELAKLLEEKWILCGQMKPESHPPQLHDSFYP